MVSRAAAASQVPAQYEPTFHFFNQLASTSKTAVEANAFVAELSPHVSLSSILLTCDKSKRPPTDSSICDY